MATENLLATHLQGRANNFDFLRFFAASLVVFAHAFGLSPDGYSMDPLAYLSRNHVHSGGLAVAVFFVISGFLITMSYENTGGNREFLLKRCLRIFPGLAVVVLLSLFLLGPIVSTSSPADYFSDAQTYTYISNLFLFRMQGGLPGVFANNPLPDKFNGSLWTLWYEFVCYLAVLALGMAGWLRWKPILFLICVGLLITVDYSDVPLLWRLNDFLSLLRWQEDYLELLPYFAGGSLIYLLRKQIPISPVFALAAFLLLLFTARTNAFEQVFVFAGSYLILFLAYCRSLQLGNFSKYGDFSYGIYIYAYPIQQTVAHYLAPDIHWGGNFVISYPLILICAIASWHWVERPALAMKQRLHAILIRR